MVVFWPRLTTFVTGVLVRRCESRWFDDVCNVGRPLVARPGPAAAHGYRSLALSASWAGCLKPPSPLRAPAEPRLKPPSPLRARNGCFWCSFRAQRRCRFQRSLVGGAQWCCWFQCRHVVAPCARKSSPSALTMAQKWRFLECWASFFAEMLLNGPCWASFFAEMLLEGPCWASFFAEAPLGGPCWGSFFADRPSGEPTGRTLSRRSPGRRPFYWQC